MLAKFYLTPFERDLKKNCLAVRQFVLEVVNRRKAENESVLSSKDDLLALLLSNEVFSNDDEVIVDELLTIIFAGSQTSANTTQNLIFHLNKHPEAKEKILEEVKRVSGVRAGNSKDILDCLDLENSSDLSFFGNCFSEAMRLQPPVYFSSTVRMS